MTTCRATLAIALVMGCCSAWAQEPLIGVPPADPRVAGQVGTVIPPGPVPFTPPGPVAVPSPPERWIESSWYTRVDYFHWNERIDGMDFVNEYGTLVTLGYTRRVGPERFRLELFGGSMHYKGFAQFEDGSLDPLSSTTDYLGMRGEFDLLLEPDWLPQVSFLVGIGTRFWFRDINDGISQSDYLVLGYEEAWWTVYPYFGMEKRRVPTSGMEFYWAGRIGLTPLNFERIVCVSDYGSNFAVTLHPRTGITGQFEAGLRGQRFYLSAFFEAWTWAESPIVADTLQPKSQMMLAGLKTGLSY
jgi:hypothetical protein